MVDVSTVIAESIVEGQTSTTGFPETEPIITPVQSLFMVPPLIMVPEPDIVMVPELLMVPELPMPATELMVF